MGTIVDSFDNVSDKKVNLSYSDEVAMKCSGVDVRITVMLYSLSLHCVVIVICVVHFW